MSNPLEMSDEDFLKQNAPPQVTPEDRAAAHASEPVVETPAPVVETPAEPEDNEDPAPTPVAVEPEEDDREVEAEVKPTANADPMADTPPAPEADKGEKPKEGEQKETEPKKEPETPNYESFYKEIMKPFKANGKMIELKEPSEAIALMQMGANYTKKLQELQPVKKLVMMLEDNKLLDEDRLSFAIDLVNKNPEAIKKLLIDAKIDPVEIDTSIAPTYTEGNHRVTDERVAFAAVVEDLQGSDEGKKTLQAIHTDWDDASKNEAWANPEIIRDINIQRNNGVYDTITAELERQRILGKIPTNLSFLEAYKLVGNHLVQNNGFAHLVVKPVEEPKPVLAPLAPVATRVAAPKPVLANGDKAKAAAPSRTVPKTAKPLVNPLAMSDEDFIAMSKIRV